tara:strand:- start:8193 stop:9287 length:1095 start_codon:yes stop_codon:yes gene_type:complete
MKKIILYGEFIEQSTTGIAYINTCLRQALLYFKNEVSVISEPRVKDYNKEKVIINKNFYIKEFFNIFFKIIRSSKKDISFITLSQGKLGLIKTLIIVLILCIKTERIFLYIHRGDLNTDYFGSFYKKILIGLIIKLSYNVIFLSSSFIDKKISKRNKNKFIVIPNALNKSDTKKSKKLFNKKVKIGLDSHKKILKLIYCGNIQSQKGIHEIIKSVKLVNEKHKDLRFTLDIYGMCFEEFEYVPDLIEYKGILTYKNRLEIMHQYDLLVIASKSEGMPMILIESLAIGLPFITTKVGAIPELIGPNYPYICKSNYKSIMKNIEKFFFNYRFNEESILELISLNHQNFNKNFQYINYFKNINKIIQ